MNKNKIEMIKQLIEQNNKMISLLSEGETSCKTKNEIKKEVKPTLRDGYKFNYIEKKKLSNFFKSSNVKIALNILKNSINEIKNIPVQNSQVKTKLSNYELIKSMIEVIQKKVSKENGYFKIFESLLNQKSFDLINNFQTKIYKK